MSDSAMEAAGVRVSFGGRRALNGLDLVVRRGETTVLLGPNGAGKSTLLRAALGLVRLESGVLRTGGLDVRRDAPAVRRLAGYVPDRPDFDPWSTLASNLRFLAPFYPGFDADEAARLAEALRVPKDRPFRELSRGQAVKAALVLALAPRPSLLLMDEPFGGLDPASRDDVVRGIIGEMCAEGRTVVIATHDLDVASRLGSRAVLIAAGRATCVIDPEDVGAKEGSAGLDASGREVLSDVPYKQRLRRAFDGVSGGVS